MVIELAPNHKIGLPLANPILIASGFGGYGMAYQPLIDLSVFGGIVTQPITLRPRRGSPQPRLVEVEAGFLLNTGQQNPGVRKIIRQQSKPWSRSPIPIIAHLPADDPDDLMRTARALANTQMKQGTSTLAAIELGLPLDVHPQEVITLIEVIQAATELPLLIKLPLNGPIELAEAAADAHADALVIGTPPVGTAYTKKEWITGHFYGPVLFNLVLPKLRQLLTLDLPIVAMGGIHSQAEVGTFLKAGAAAVQLDSLMFKDPVAAYKLAAAYSISVLSDKF